MSTFMTLATAREVAASPGKLAAEIGHVYEDWAKRCHEISLALLKTGMFGPGRIARGWASGVRGQHSWIVLHGNVYNQSAVIVDPTLWHWRGKPDLGIYVAKAETTSHEPHGKGSIWEAGRPDWPTSDIIELTPSFELSELAQFFLGEEMLGQLDRRGWSQLANGAMEQWPSAEIIAAMDDTPALKALVPIDILGMLTRRNPLGVYLATSGAGVLPAAS